MGNNTSNFFENSLKFTNENFILSLEDIIKSRIRTFNIFVLKFQVDNSLNIEFIDADGQKTERNNWYKAFQGVSYLLFNVLLSGFNQTMYGEHSVARTEDSMALFQNTAKSPIFRQNLIFLIFNKADLFERKLFDYPEKYP